MKKLLLLFPVLFIICCVPASMNPSIKPDTGIFLVQGIESVENDSSRVLCKYKIVSDTLNSEQKNVKGLSGDNPFIFFLTDTSGKYKIGDTLLLSLKINTYE